MQLIQVCLPQDGGGDIPEDESASVAQENDAERRNCLRPLRFSSDSRLYSRPYVQRELPYSNSVEVFVR